MSTWLLWLKGLIASLNGRLIGAVAGVSLTVALIASLGSFIVSSDAVMTEIAIKDVPVDWQILLNDNNNKDQVISAVKKATGYTALSTVGFADVKGFEAKTGSTTQVTAAGQVVGIDSNYINLFPGQIRSLIGQTKGVLVDQQTAANLQVSAGDYVSIRRVGLDPVKIKIDGIITIPNADSLFQKVGAPQGAQLQAPPDNVILLPLDTWNQIFEPQLKNNPSSVHTQLHVKIKHQLSQNPDTAYTQVNQLAKNVEAQIAGSGVIGNNLAARLDGVRSDALYAYVLFIFLGLPGAFLAILLTIAVVNSGRTRHREEQALLRVRGASLNQILYFRVAEALIIGIGGIVIGMILTFILSHWMTAAHIAMDSTLLLWLIISSAIGLILSLAAVLIPAWQDTRNTTVSSRKVVGRLKKPLWQRLYIDILFLLIAGAFFWRSASTGYQLVMAPEGVPQTSVDYTAFIAPFFLWVGGSLLFMRLLYKWLGIRNLISVLLKPISKQLSNVVSSSISRQRLLIVRGIILTALAFSFAVSTSVFNLTYNVQSHVDAVLTNGADVTVTATTNNPATSKLSDLKAIPGVVKAEAMQHRYAYVGNDLQDIYGIDAKQISEVTSMSNAYFQNGDASQTLLNLANTTDGVLVSEETVKDYQLKKGDIIKLRLQNAKDHQYHVVPFRFIGVVREFPTAPKDSFLVANDSYVSQMTGIDAKETILLKTNMDAVSIADKARKIISGIPGAKVNDLNSTQSIISSGLTAFNLHSLTSLELIFSILFVAGTAGLILALGLNERRRTFAILSALGAKQNQLGAFLWSEGVMVLIPGGIIGTLLGFGIAQMLVKMLKGVFDPPPETLFIPWGYLWCLMIFATISMVIGVVSSIYISQKQVTEDLRGS
ncbi:FtsX-like permease family protein [Metabacillus sp. RGM 3146]|uniref:ABC transporter permease n=1 Tax=Metabacillus sp. RGM 3146 TaxID=3401092 RepID=UPI003B9D7C6A